MKISIFASSPLLFTLVIYSCIPVNVNATQLPLVQYPPGAASIEPAPNVIISVDDSGSMGADGITSLKNALKDTFAESNIPNKRLRIAWQSMNGCPGIPYAGNCKSLNSMKILDDTHRTNFLTWVDTLTASGGTPSHMMIRNAGDYLMKVDTSKNSPWAEIPGEKVGKELSCRKSFHIFMTDGSWNSSAASTSNHVDADRNTTAYTTITPGNIDGTQKTLPDGTIFDPTDKNLKIYTDNWGDYSYAKEICTGTGKNKKCTTSTIDDPINTLSDLAFYYWATDLQPRLAPTDSKENVKPIMKVNSDETIEIGNQKITFTPYWNPKNNPATWRNLTTYTIGFATATNWNTSSTNSTQLLNWAGDTYKGDYQNLALGIKTWPSPLCMGNNPNINGTAPCDGSTAYGNQNNVGNRRTELWHMAINGRGKFIPANTSDDLKNAFKDIVSNIINDTSTPITSFASGSSSVNSQGTKIFSANYDADGWTGNISALTIKLNTSTNEYELTQDTSWGPTWNPTSPNYQSALTSRKVFFSDGGIENNGKIFSYDNLSSNNKNIFSSALSNPTNTQKTTLGTAIVNYIKGDTGNENKTVAGITIRKRSSIQSDIINSKIWYTGIPNSGYNLSGYAKYIYDNKNRMPMLYVGGNDGMLHGFSATDASEKFSYIPNGVMNNLPSLANPDYEHQYYVDGSPYTGDIKDGDTWKTMLVGSLGAGGKGYFILNVSNPEGFDASSIIMDKTGEVDDDIGHIMSDPVPDEFNPQLSTQITMMNNGRWAVIMGNGVNSANERPVLLIQYLDGDKSLSKIVATTAVAEATTNGLSAPRLVDLNNDGTPDIAYAGDLRGNMWKFDLSSKDSSKWGVAFQGNPFYTAINSSNQRQPITTTPLVRVRTQGGMMVAFGTGRNYTEGDRTDTTQQSFYSIYDNTKYVTIYSGTDKGMIGLPDNYTPTAVGSGRSLLVSRTFNSEQITGENQSSDFTFWNMSDTQTELHYCYNENSNDCSDGKKGWYFDFPENPDGSSERVIRNPRFYQGSNVIEILSDAPASGSSIKEESCSPASIPGKSWRTFMGIEYGRRPSVQLLDANGDGLYTNLDFNVNRVTSSSVDIPLSGKGVQMRIDDQGNIVVLNNIPSPPTVINWRQIR